MKRSAFYGETHIQEMPGRMKGPPPKRAHPEHGPAYLMADSGCARGVCLECPLPDCRYSLKKKRKG